ncbi:MAG: tetratricopeptide repeat protein [Candidatus Thorarchaeota archaeon]|jgi:cytochrome c-type biogenesis protein CcmH/NrfG
MTNGTNDKDLLRQLHDGIRLVGEGKVEEAETILRSVLKLQPENADALWLLGRTLEQQGKLRESLDVYSRAAQLEPDRAVFHESLGTMFILTGNVLDGKEALRKALALDPEALKPSEYTFGKLIEKSPENKIYWHGLEIVLDLQGKMEMSQKVRLKAGQNDSTR